MSGNLVKMAVRMGQQVKEAVGATEERTEYPPEFQAQDAAVRAARDMTEALSAAFSRRSASYLYTETSLVDGNFGEQSSVVGRVGKVSGDLANVLAKESVYGKDLLVLSRAETEVQLLEARLTAELDLSVVQPYKRWLRGPGNDFIRARKTLGQLRLEKDAAGGTESGTTTRRFQDQMALVRKLMNAVPDQVEEHRHLIRAYLRLLAAHTAALSALYARSLAQASHPSNNPQHNPA